jgi:hypothetical protein
MGTINFEMWVSSSYLSSVVFGSFFNCCNCGYIITCTIFQLSLSLAITPDMFRFSSLKSVLPKIFSSALVCFSGEGFVDIVPVIRAGS